MGISVAFLVVWEDWDGSLQILTEGSGDSGCASLWFCSQYNHGLFQRGQSELSFYRMPCELILPLHSLAGLTLWPPQTVDAETMLSGRLSTGQVVREVHGETQTPSIHNSFLC